MPEFVGFLLRHALIGCAVALALVAGLVGFDVAGLGRLLATSASGPLALFALTGAMCVTCASLQMGFAVMMLGNDREDRSGGRLVPVPVRVRARRLPPR